jgi:hypothetical protein
LNILGYYVLEGADTGVACFINPANVTMCYHKANRILCQLETLTIQGNVKVTPKQFELGGLLRY